MHYFFCCDLWWPYDLVRDHHCFRAMDVADAEPEDIEDEEYDLTDTDKSK